MARRFNVSIPDKVWKKHQDLIEKVSLSLLLQQAIEREARNPTVSLPAFIGAGI